MFVDPFTSLHTVLSLIAIVVGIPVIADLIAGRVRGLPTAIFLVTAILTARPASAFPSTRSCPRTSSAPSRSSCSRWC
jgi:hypothetical protein